MTARHRCRRRQPQPNQDVAAKALDQRHAFDQRPVRVQCPDAPDPMAIAPESFRSGQLCSTSRMRIHTRR